MILAKNYEIISKFVKVMPRIIVALFFRTRPYISVAGLEAKIMRLAPWPL